MYLLMFGEANEIQLKCVKETLDSFCLMSGQEISTEKSSILFSDNVPRGTRNNIIRISGFRETQSFGKYLGIPLKGKANRRNDFQYVIDQVANKLSGWKARNFSFAGRVTLAKSVIEAIPTYPMMTNIIPKACIKDIQRIQRGFIWGDTNTNRKYHAVNWDIVTRAKCDGGLGLRNLSTMNTTCIMKLGCKILNGEEDLWCQVLRKKYNVVNNSSSLQAKMYDSSLWKDISKASVGLHDLGVWRIGNGMDINPWQHSWIERGLNLAELNIHIPDDMIDITVADLVDDKGGWNWTLLNWLPLDLKLKIAAILPPLSENGSDKLIFSTDEEGHFSINQMYKYATQIGDEEESKVWNRIWSLNVPERVRSFIWILEHDRLLTNSRISLSGFGMDGCSLCGAANESSLHVLRDCNVVKGVWDCIIPNSIKSNFFFAGWHDWIKLNLFSELHGCPDWCNSEA